MKKIIFSLAVVLGLASCNSWDDEQTQNYGDGPAITIDLTTTADSSFTFTVNPAQGTNYYTYTVVEGTEAEEVDASLLLKNAIGGIAGGIKKYSENASITETMRNAKTNAPLCSPNTSYVIYAVAASDKGVIGKVASQVVTTTDGETPVVADMASTDSYAAVKFSENVALGDGSISGKYYLEWDPAFAAKEIAAEDIVTTINGSVVKFEVNNVPAGAYVFISWAEGAFVDSKGNKCPAMNSDFNMTTGAIEGVNMHLANVAWDINPANIGPDAGSLISDYKTWQGTITFDENVYRNDHEVKAGDIYVKYANSKKSTTIALDPTDWEVKDNVVTFRLPEAAADGDVITVGIKENVLFDICGNGNNAFVSSTDDAWWKYFAATKDMVLGNFGFTYVPASDDEPQWHDGGIVTIEEDPEAEAENGIIIKNLYLEGSKIPGEYDLNSGKVYVYAYYGLGIVPGKESNYGLITYSISGKDAIEFTINPDGTLTSTDFAVVACDENYESALGWWDKFSIAKFTPANAAGAAKRTRAISVKSVKKANVKMSAKALRRYIRK